MARTNIKLAAGSETGLGANSLFLRQSRQIRPSIQTLSRYVLPALISLLSCWAGKETRRGEIRRSAVRSLIGLGNGPQSPIRSNENGTVLRQLLLRGLFVEIFSGRALATRTRPWPLGRVEVVS